MNEQITLSIGSAQRTATVVSDSGCIEVPGKGFVRFYVVSGMVWYSYLNDSHIDTALRAIFNHPK